MTTTISVFQNFDYNISVGSIPSIASQFKFINASRQAKATAWRANNPTIDTSYYFPFHRDFGAYETYTGNNLAYWQANHPDWILYKSDGVTPASYLFGSTSLIVLDITNPAVVAWQISTYATPASASGVYTYIYADNLTFSNDYQAYGVYKSATPASPMGGTFTQLYTGSSTDATYKSDVVAWVTAFKTALVPTGLKFIANFDPSPTAYTDASVTSVVTQLDGVHSERGFTNYGNTRITETTWLNFLTFIQSVQSQSKVFLLNAILYDSSQQTLEYIIANYLMANNGLCDLYIASHDSTSYGNYVWHSEYDLAIGSAQETTQNPTTNVYKRLYTTGEAVFCNATSGGSYPLTLPSGTWHSLYSGPSTIPNGGLYTGTIQLSPNANLGSGLVLQPYTTPTNKTPRWLFHS